MATRYWVGGSGTWSISATTNWSTSSGGTGGASAPTVNDDVVIDEGSNTPGSTFSITVSSDVYCNNFIYERTTVNSFTFINCGNFIIHVNSDVSWSGVGGTCTGMISFKGDYNNQMTTNANGASSLRCVSGGSRIQSILGVNQLMSTLDIVNSDVVYNNTASINTLNMQSTVSRTLLLSINTKVQGNVNVSSNSNVVGGTLRMNSSVSPCTLEVNGTLTSLSLEPAFANLVYNIKGTGTITSISDAVSSAFVLQFDTTSNLKVNTWEVTGVSGGVITVRSNVSGVRSTVTKTGGGTVSTSFMSVTDMQPSPDDTWISTNSTNGGNNYRWYFNSFTKPTSSMFFGSHA